MTEIKYDVFMSFRGKDTRTTITSYIYNALCWENIETYKDDEKLESGDEISPSLLNAIQRSKISVVIFSERFASSWWCLDELVHILECRKRNGQFVIPIFYHVDPFHVRYQRESYATEFAILEERFKDRLKRLNGWRSALTEAAGLSGNHYPGNYRTEPDFVGKIVKDICKKLKRMPSCYTKGLFGIERRIYQMESLLCLDSSNVHVIGIWGMGGIGKTTIAKVVCQRYSSKFEACWFLELVREEQENFGGKILLRVTSFPSLSCEENVSISSIRTFVRGKLRYKKGLIVVDDVNQAEQLDLSDGDDKDFALGTRFILTSRDIQVLRNAFEEVKIYHVEELNCSEALDLLEFHAFKGISVPKKYEDLCSRVVNYSKGIPLALKILGSTLNRRSMEYWESLLDKLQEFPNDRIQGVLKISYNRLDFTEKMIFLDIACFFKGWYKDHVIRILEGCNFYPEINIVHLIDLSLVSIGQHNTIEMHDLIQKMGCDLVRNESFKEPGNRSRVWIPKDVRHMLQKNTGTEQVEGLFYEIGRWPQDKFPHVCQERYLNMESFSRLSNLRLLKISYSEVDLCKCKLYPGDGVESLSLPSAPSLFHWDEYPLKSLPLDLNLSNLVELRIPHSQLERLWDGAQPLWNLKEIIGYGSERLVEIPDLSLARNLLRLDFEGCTNLAQLPSSFQNLESLVRLELNFCTNLERLPPLPRNINFLDLTATKIHELPSSIEEAENLDILVLDCCYGVKSLPQLPRNITILWLGQTSIKVLPSSIDSLSILKSLVLCDCKSLVRLPTNIHKLKSLERLLVDGCSKLEHFPEILEPMKNLWRINSSEAGIKSLPLSIMNLTALKDLFLSNCENLESLPYSICNLSCLVNLDLSGCTKLEKLPPLPAGLSLLSIKNCTNLKCLEGLPVFLCALYAYNCRSLEVMPSLKTLLSHGLWKQYLPYFNGKIDRYCGVDYAFENCNCLSKDGNVCKEITELSQLIILRMASVRVKELSCYINGFINEVNFCSPGNVIPKWFDYQSEGCSILMDLPLHWFNSEFLGFALCIVIDGNPNFKSSHVSNEHTIGWPVHFMCKSHFKTNNNESYETDYCVGNWGPFGGWVFPEDRRQLNSNHLFMFYYPLRGLGASRSHQDYCPYLNSTQASFTFYIHANGIGDHRECWIVKKTGIRMLYAPEAEELGFVEEAMVDIATKPRRQRDEPESSKSNCLSSVKFRRIDRTTSEANVNS